MKYLILFLLSLSVSNLIAQDFRHEFTDPDDSLKLKGLKLYLEIDSVYEVSDSSGVKFALEIINQGTETLEIINPLYDTELRINPSFWQLPSKKKIKLREVSRWPYPHYAKDIKPYRLEKVAVSDKEIAKDQYPKYWETDTLNIDSGHKIRYDLNLFEQVLADENNNPYIEPLSTGEYYVIFNIRMKINRKPIQTAPLRFKLRLE